MHKLTVPAVAEKVPSLPGSMEDKDLEAVRTRRISMFRSWIAVFLSKTTTHLWSPLYNPRARRGSCLLQGGKGLPSDRHLFKPPEWSSCAPSLRPCSSIRQQAEVSLIYKYNTLKGCSFSCQGAALHAAPKSLACAASRLAHPPNKLENDLRQDSFEYVRSSNM